MALIWALLEKRFVNPISKLLVNLGFNFSLGETGNRLKKAHSPIIWSEVATKHNNILIISWYDIDANFSILDLLGKDIFDDIVKKNGALVSF